MERYHSAHSKKHHCCLTRQSARIPCGNSRGAWLGYFFFEKKFKLLYTILHILYLVASRFLKILFWVTLLLCCNTQVCCNTLLLCCDTCCNTLLLCCNTLCCNTLSLCCATRHRCVATPCVATIFEISEVRSFVANQTARILCGNSSGVWPKHNQSFSKVSLCIILHSSKRPFSIYIGNWEESCLLRSQVNPEFLKSELVYNVFSGEWSFSMYIGDWKESCLLRSQVNPEFLKSEPVYNVFSSEWTLPIYIGTWVKSCLLRICM